MSTPSHGAQEPSVVTAHVVAGRIYSGQVPSERALERRGRLIAAGLELFGTLGFSHTKIKALCQYAGVSERYFYESFESREQLLIGVYGDLTGRLMANVMTVMHAPGVQPHVAIRAGVAAVVDFMLKDPRNAQIMLVEIVGVSPELETKRHNSLQAFATESMRQLLQLSGIDPDEAQQLLQSHPECEPLVSAMEFARLTAVSSVGAVNHMLLDALLTGTAHNSERIIEVAFELMRNAAAGIRALADTAD